MLCSIQGKLCGTCTHESDLFDFFVVLYSLQGKQISDLVVSSRVSRRVERSAGRILFGIGLVVTLQVSWCRVG